MKKFDVTKENFEARTDAFEGWSTSRILSAFDCKSFYDSETLATFENVEEARAFFEEQKEHCHTRRVSSNIGWLLEAEILSLCEMEYDEDDEFVDLDILDRYADPLEPESEDD